MLGRFKRRLWLADAVEIRAITSFGATLWGSQWEMAWRRISDKVAPGVTEGGLHRWGLVSGTLAGTRPRIRKVGREVT